MEERKKEYLKILYKEVGELPKVLKIEDTLKAKQALVEGLIEVVPYEDVLLICNEESKILNMDANLVFDYGYIAGNCFVVGDDYKNAGFKSLTDEEIEKYKKDLIKRSVTYKKPNQQITFNNHNEDLER